MLELLVVLAALSAVVALIIAIRSPIRFSEEDLVVFRRDVKRSVEHYGPGPYRVISQRPANPEVSRHPQLVEIKSLDGKPMGIFSGYWFKKA